MSIRIKRFNESIEQFDISLPEEIELFTSNGNFNYKLTNVYNDVHAIKSTYTKNIKKEDSGELVIDEPENLQLDFNYQNQEDKQSINVCITYGNSVKYDFLIERPNILKITSYSGFGSKLDSGSKFGFSNEAIIGLVEFLNSLGFEFTEKHFQFLDKYPRSYKRYESFEMNPVFNGVILVIDNAEPNGGSYLPDVINYLTIRGINYMVTSSVTEMETILKTENVIGVISTGSDYRITSPRSETEQELSHKALKEINKPILGECYGFQSMANFYGSEIEDSKNFFNDNITLTEWSKDCEIFKGLNIDDMQFSVSFHDKISKCPDGFRVIAKYEDNILGIENKKLMRWGIAFHPEDIEKTYPILDNFINFCKQNLSDEVVKSFESFIKNI